MKDEKEFGMSPAALSAALNGDIENALIASTPGGIERQEAQGQTDFVASETLPTECPREDLESLGFVFGEEADDIFTTVQFPKGWTKVPTDHSMWSNLVDDKGRTRGGIFYKAAFYDRSAFLKLTTKIKYGRMLDFHDDYKEDCLQYYVAADENVLYKTEQVSYEKQYDDNYFELDDALNNEVQEWVEKNYPDYKSPMAYWD